MGATFCVGVACTEPGARDGALESDGGVIECSVEVVVLLNHTLDPFISTATNDEDLAVEVEQRMIAAATVTAPIATRLRAIGATNIVEFWLNPDVAAHVPAGAVATIKCWPEVMRVAADRAGARPPDTLAVTYCKDELYAEIITYSPVCE